jgi:hypothetical protein
VIATVHADASPPRVTISGVTGDVPVTRMVNGVPTLVRGVSVGGVIDDYECPQETPVTYSATGVTVTSVVELPNVGDWLVHLGQPDLSVLLDFGSHDGWDAPPRVSVVDVPGGPTVAVTMERASARGTFTLNTYERDEETALRALLADGSPLFLSTHFEVGFGPCYLAVTDVAWERFTNYVGDQSRVVSLAYVEVARPAAITSRTFTIDNLVGTINSLTGVIDQLGA